MEQIQLTETTERIYEKLKTLQSTSFYTCGSGVEISHKNILRITGLVTSTGLGEIKKVLGKANRKNYWVDEKGLFVYTNEE